MNINEIETKIFVLWEIVELNFRKPFLMVIYNDFIKICSPSIFLRTSSVKNCE